MFDRVSASIWRYPLTGINAVTQRDCSLVLSEVYPSVQRNLCTVWRSSGNAIEARQANLA